MQVKIIRRGPKPEEVERNIRFIFTSVQNGTLDLAKLAMQRMRNTIKSHKKRKGSRENLERAIKVHIIESSAEVSDIGVGQISYLNQVYKNLRRLFQIY